MRAIIYQVGRLIHCLGIRRRWKTLLTLVVLSIFSIGPLAHGSEQLIVWGWNNYGQCNVPEEIQSGVTQLAAGGGHSFALKDGSVIAWGQNDSGQCNVPSNAQNAVTQIASGGWHSLALRDGGVIAWGLNEDGQCNVPMDAQSGVTQIAGGGNHSLALKGGEVIAWGRNNDNQCNVPADAQSGVTQIAPGGWHSLALKDGGVIAWGRNNEGQCNVPIDAQSGVTQIAAGGWHSLALKDGQVIAWGWNGDGQCNVPVDAQNGVAQIAGIGWHSLALKDGRVIAWGDNDHGQCDVPAAAQSGVTQIAGGGAHSLAIKTGASLTSCGPWPMFHHDIRHTGLSEYVGPGSCSLDWSYLTGGDVLSSPSISSDGSIKVGSMDKGIYTFSSNGTLVWSFLTGAGVRSSAAIDVNRNIHVGSMDNRVYCIGSLGTLIWSYDFTEGATGSVFSSPTIDSNGLSYVGSENDRYYALYSTGALNWSFRTGYDVHSSAAMTVDGRTYVGSEDNNVYSFNSNGTLRWSYRTGAANNSLWSAPALDAEGRIYIGSSDNNFYSLTSSGALIWSYRTGNEIKSSPAIDGAGAVYVDSMDYNLYLFNAIGTLRWSYKLAGGVYYNSPGIGSDGLVYIGSNSNILHCINPTGSLEWSYAVGDSVWSSPAIGSTGKLYIGSNDNRLYCIKATVTPATPTPTVTPTPTPTSEILQPVTVRGCFNYEDPDYIGEPIRNAKLRVFENEFYGLNPTAYVGKTNNDGCFEIRDIPNNDGPLEGGIDIAIRVYAEYGLDNSEGACVGASMIENYAFTSPVYGNCHGGILDIGEQVIPYAEPQWQNSGPWAIYDAAITAYTFFKDGEPTWHNPSIKILYPDQSIIGILGADYFFNPTLCRISAKSDADPFDRPAIYHEYAHSVMAKIYGSMPFFNPFTAPNPHYAFSEADAGFAFSEGWADFCMYWIDCYYRKLNDIPFDESYTRECVEAPIYPTANPIANKHWADIYDILDNANSYYECDGSNVECAIAEVLWDIADGTGSILEDIDGDGMDARYSDLLDTIIKYKPQDIHELKSAWQTEKPDTFQVLQQIYWMNKIERHPDTVGPPPVSEFQATNNSDGSITLNWVNPSSDIDFSSVLVIRKGHGTATMSNEPLPQSTFKIGEWIGYWGLPGYSYAGGKVIYLGNGTSFNDKDVHTGSDYFYFIYSCDDAHNYSPTFLQQPVACNVKALKGATISVADHNPAIQVEGPLEIIATVLPISQAFDAYGVVIGPQDTQRDTTGIYSFVLGKPGRLSPGIKPLITAVSGLNTQYNGRLFSIPAIPRGAEGKYDIIVGLVPAGIQPMGIEDAIPGYVDWMEIMVLP